MQIPVALLADVQREIVFNNRQNIHDTGEQFTFVNVVIYCQCLYTANLHYQQKAKVKIIPFPGEWLIKYLFWHKIYTRILSISSHLC